MCVIRTMARFLERFYERVMRMWPDARERMDPMTRAEYKARIRKVRQHIDDLKARCE